MTSQPPMIRCQGLTKRYGDVTALEALDLSIAAGSIFGFIGHNGAGKTTTIRILAGLLRPTAGKASIDGLDVQARRREVTARVGYLPDAFGVYDRMRVWEYLDFFAAAFKLPRRARRDRIEEVLEITDSTELRDRFVEALSHGMKRRIGIARTLLHDPAVLLLDEPANGLDPQARVLMRRLLRRLADAGKTLLVSSHILPELAAVCDSVGIIHQGRLRTAGAIASVLAQIRRHRLMELTCLGERSAAAAALERTGRCQDVAPADDDTAAVRFRFDGADADLAGLLRTLLEAGLGVVTLREVPLSLEDAYMAVSAADDSEDASPAREAPGP